jgi:hypothetical protein
MDYQLLWETLGQMGRFLIFCHVAREDPERAATVESHPCAKGRARMGHPAALKTLNDALITERMRGWDSKKSKLSDDPHVAELQNQLDVPRPIAEKVVKEHRRRAIAEAPSRTDKVQ